MEENEEKSKIWQSGKDEEEITKRAGQDGWRGEAIPDKPDSRESSIYPDSPISTSEEIMQEKEGRTRSVESAALSFVSLSVMIGGSQSGGKAWETVGSDPDPGKPGPARYSQHQ